MLASEARVLIVEDSGTMREMISSCLRELKLTSVITAANGRAALEYIDNTDLIVSDWDMPEMNGIELLKEVRSRQSSQHVPFIMLTAISMKQEIITAIKAGVTDYLSKPFQPKHLLARVEMYIRQIDKTETNNAPGFKDLTNM